MFLSAAWGGLALMRRGIRAVRRLAAERRRAARHTARRASNDPHGRATVGMLRGPGVLRVLLLWVRGDARDASCVEVRTLAEQRDRRGRRRPGRGRRRRHVGGRPAGRQRPRAAPRGSAQAAPAPRRRARSDPAPRRAVVALPARSTAPGSPNPSPTPARPSSRTGW